MEELSAASINKKIKRLKQQRKILEDQMDTLDSEIGILDDQLNTIRIERYWIEHPDETRVNIGDKIIVNSQFQEYKLNELSEAQCRNYLNTCWKLGVIYRIEYLNPVKKTGTIASALGLTECSYEAMQSMRLDYVEQYEFKHKKGSEND